MRKLIIWLITWLILSYHAYSQQIIAVDKWKEYVDNLADDAVGSEKLETLYTELSYLSEHPFDLNRVTEEQLSRLPFLSDKQVEQILHYRKRVRSFVSVYELKAIYGMDYATVELLYPFVYIGEKPVDKRKLSVKNMLKYGNNELILRYDNCFQQKSGYQSYPDSVLQKYPNRKYLGEPFYSSLRYSYRFDERLMWGFVAEKDAGEPFWTDRHKGFDYYSFHFLLKSHKAIKTLALGDYKLSFGQGLVLSHDFSPSRAAMVTQAERRTSGIRRHYSTNEQDFFRGAAATLSLNKSCEWTLFYSGRKCDAAVVNDTFPSLKTDGLHRLERDWKKRKKLDIHTFGGHLRWIKPRFQVGVTAVDYYFGGATFYPQELPYNRFAFRGKNNFNIGVDYLLKSRMIKIYGETAVSANGAIATMNALRLAPASYFSLLLLHRYYDKRYQSLYGNAFGQNSTVQNEQGYYCGLQWQPFAHWKLSAYADFFRFPWLKYQAVSLQTGKEYMVQADYMSGRRFSSYLRYKEKRRNEDDVQRRLRWQAIYGWDDRWYLRTSMDGTHLTARKKKEWGYMLAQSIGWKPRQLPLRMDLYAAWFSTDSYSVRISSYEKNLLYAFYMPSLYGKGVRLVATANWDICRLVKLSAKLGHTTYTDREIIGSGTEQIQGKHKTDLSLLFRFKF